MQNASRTVFSISKSFRAPTSLLPSQRHYAPRLSQMSDGNPKVIEKAKEKVIRGEVENILSSAPGWNQALATESEADVKADREPNRDNIEILQQESVKIIIERVQPTYPDEDGTNGNGKEKVKKQAQKESKK